MLSSKFFPPNGSKQHQDHHHHPSSSKRPKLLGSSSTKPSTTSQLLNHPPSSPDHPQDQELPDLENIFNPTTLSLTNPSSSTTNSNDPHPPHQSSKPIESTTTSTSIQPNHAQPIRLIDPISTPTHHDHDHHRSKDLKNKIHSIRPSTHPRLARFLCFARNSASIDSQPAIDHQQSHVIRPLPSSSNTHHHHLRLKLSRRLSPPIKWEQPKTIYQPGYEDPINRNHDPPPKSRNLSIGHDTQGDDHLQPKLTKDLCSTKSKTNQSDSNHAQDPNLIQQRKPTQLEQQWAEFKKQYPHLIILMEVGFKIRLFGSDAVLASKVLSIGHLAIPGHESAFFPKTNLNLHLSRLVMAGHKVGLVSQSETRSLKNSSAESNHHSAQKNRLFKRHLSGVYSLSTWTEPDPSNLPSSSTIYDHQPQKDLYQPSTSNDLFQSWIVSFYEPTSHQKQQDPFKNSSSHQASKSELSMVAICPQNGDIIWDTWIDDHIRSKLETRMCYFKPIEIILPLSGLDPRSEKLINWIINDTPAGSSSKARIESTERDYNPQTAYELVNRFCQPLKAKKSVQNQSSSEINTSIEKSTVEPTFLHHIVELSDGVLIALAGLIIHLKSYQLESIFRQPSQFNSFSSKSYMVLDANTLRNLEIFENSSDRTERGSLFWVLDRTKTSMGKRLLKQWIGKPLIDLRLLQERADAVHELAISQTHPLVIKIRRTLGMRLPDLEKTLVRIQYGKCTEKELIRFLDVINELATTFGSSASSSSSKTIFTSSLLKDIFLAFSSVKDQVIGYRSELNGKAILKGEYEDMFIDTDEKYPQLTDLKDCISCIESELLDHLKTCRNLLENPKLEYITVGTDELLIEVRLQNLDRVPKDWITLSSTKTVHRFRTPEGQRLLEERNKYRDMLIQTTRGCFIGFLRSMEEDYERFRNVIQKLAMMDCLMSMAITGIENNYCRVDWLEAEEDRMIDVIAGRHPIVEQLLDDPIVPNNFCLKNDLLTTMILTGNNMGGKSVTAKMIACIVILAQIGCYVPAERAKIGIFDGCYTRMGMSEELGQGRSAFMVEMNETSKILRLASSRSLVIMDELGYGTSTYDGVAIASAVLNHLITRIGCCTIFITHYPQLNEFALKYPNSVKSYHMKFIESQIVEEDKNKHLIKNQITFLYKLKLGLNSNSHGIHVAKLAGLPSNLLLISYKKSDDLRVKCLLKTKQNSLNLDRVGLIRKLLMGLASSKSSSSSIANNNTNSINDNKNDDQRHVIKSLLSYATSIRNSQSIN